MKTREEKRTIVERFTHAQMGIIEDLHSYQKVMEERMDREWKYWEAQISLMPQRTLELKKDQHMANEDLKYERDTKVFEFKQRFEDLSNRLLDELES